MAQQSTIVNDTEYAVCPFCEGVVLDEADAALAGPPGRVVSGTVIAHENCVKVSEDQSGLNDF